MTVKIEQMPPYRIAYIRRVGAYGTNNIVVMETLKRWAKEHNLYNEVAIILAIVHDNPQVVPDDQCRYDAGMVMVNDADKINDESILEGYITGGKYAVFQVEHTTEALQKVWSELFVMIQSNGLTMAINKPVIERYQVDLVNRGFCELCIPVLSNTVN